jgi:hypothetical protein
MLCSRDIQDAKVVVVLSRPVYFDCCVVDDFKEEQDQRELQKEEV